MRQDNTSSISTGDVDWINRICSQEHSFEVHSPTKSLRKQHGLIGLINPTTQELNKIGKSQWPKDTSTAKKTHTYFARLPSYPFSQFPGWMRAVQRQTLGEQFALTTGVIPPGVNLQLVLKRPSGIDDLTRFQVLAQDHNLLVNDKTDDDSAWRNFIISTKGESVKYCKALSIKTSINSIMLVYKKLREASPRQDQKFVQQFTSRRITLHHITKASKQHINLRDNL